MKCLGTQRTVDSAKLVIEKLPTMDERFVKTKMNNAMVSQTTCIVYTQLNLSKMSWMLGI